MSSNQKMNGHSGDENDAAQKPVVRLKFLKPIAAGLPDILGNKGAKVKYC